jgi:hypothetical protein
MIRRAAGRPGRGPWFSALLGLGAFSMAPGAFAQTSPEPSTVQPPPGYGQPANGYPQPAPQQGTYGQPAPSGNAPPQPGAYGQPPPNGYSPPGQDASPGGYGQSYSPPSGYRYEEPPPPPPPNDEGRKGFQMPPWSVRIDPFNWLLQGRLGIELEAGVTSFMTFELVPVFVTASKPPFLNYQGGNDPIRQESNGLGAMSGASFGLGFWLSGKPLRGYVLRALFQNYAYTYNALGADTGHTFDSVSHTDRVLMGMLGSHSRFGAFTIAGGLGLGVDLNHQERCISGRNCGELQVTDGRSTFTVSDPLYPVVLDVRLSLGVSFD